MDICGRPMTFFIWLSTSSSQIHRTIYSTNVFRLIFSTLSFIAQFIPNVIFFPSSFRSWWFDAYFQSHRTHIWFHSRSICSFAFCADNLIHIWLNKKIIKSENMTQKRTFKPVFIVQNVFNNTLFICASHLFLSHQSIIEIVFVTSFIWPINRRIFGHIEPIITFPGQIKLKADKRFYSLPNFCFSRIRRNYVPWNWPFYLFKPLRVENRMQQINLLINAKNRTKKILFYCATVRERESANELCKKMVPIWINKQHFSF